MKVTQAHRTRRLDGGHPYVWLDATYVKVRQDGRVASMAVVLAIGVRATGEREVLGVDVGASEDGALERLNKEVKRRTDVVGIFPNDAAVIPYLVTGWGTHSGHIFDGNDAPLPSC